MTDDAYERDAREMRGVRCIKENRRRITRITRKNQRAIEKERERERNEGETRNNWKTAQQAKASPKIILIAVHRESTQNDVMNSSKTGRESESKVREGTDKGTPTEELKSEQGEVGLLEAAEESGGRLRRDEITAKIEREQGLVEAECVCQFSQHRVRQSVVGEVQMAQLCAVVATDIDPEREESTVEREM
jgi:hypothetical protein